MSQKYISVCSFNVRNLVNPDVLYYGKYRYSQEQYRKKIDWLAEQLFRIDADFVGFQEVFHEDALNDLLSRHSALSKERLGQEKASKKEYKHVLFSKNEDSQPDDPKPGLGFFSRREVLDSASLQDLTKDPITAEDVVGLNYTLTRLSRPLMMIKVEFSDGLVGWVFNSHLKSKRPIFPEESDDDRQENMDFLELATGSLRSLVVRAGEALALRREVIRKSQRSSIPLIVIGDLNDSESSVTTNMIAGEAPPRNSDPETKKKYWDVELYSAARTHLRRSEGAAFHSHIYNGHYSMIDHIFTSQEFYFRNRERVGEVTFFRCFNDHLTDRSLPGSPSLGDASDHGQVLVRIRIQTEQTERDLPPFD